MNKSYLILGGACVVSSAIGAAGGYLVAKSRYDKTVDRLIAEEVEKTKKYYRVRVESLENSLTEFGSKPSFTAAQELADDDHDEVEEPELTEADKAVIEKGRQTLARASTAMVDYQGMAGNKIPLEELVSNNIFDPTRGKKALPPRDPTGKFLPKSEIQKQQDVPNPYLIEPDVFLANDPEYDQESLYYFAKDQTLIMVVDHEVVADDRVGVENLKEFPDEEDPRVIYVRNEGLQLDYQITYTKESLTTFMGLGEEEEDDDYPEGDFAEQGDLRHPR